MTKLRQYSYADKIYSPCLFSILTFSWKGVLQYTAKWYNLFISLLWLKYVIVFQLMVFILFWKFFPWGRRLDIYITFSWGGIKSFGSLYGYWLGQVSRVKEAQPAAGNQRELTFQPISRQLAVNSVGVTDCAATPLITPPRCAPRSLIRSHPWLYAQNHLSSQLMSNRTV